MSKEKELISKPEKNKTYTPMMEHFISVKNSQPDAVLLYRMGDFYETFFEDAKIVSRELNIVLTARASDDGKIPMAGIPYHALESYLPKLINRGFKVAICEQMELPTPGKKLVRRELVRVLTPGTLLENNFLSEKQNNYLAAVIKKGKSYGLALVDISTGEFKVTQIDGAKADNILLSELSRLPVSECLLSSENPDRKEDIDNTIWKDIIPETVTVTWFTEIAFNPKSAEKKLLEHFKVNSLEGFGINNSPLLIGVAGAILSYVEKTQMKALSQFNSLSTYKITDYLVIDNIAKRNLELFSTSRDNLFQGSLLSILDQTKTAMGGRLLRAWLLNPLLDKNKINQRLDVVEELFNKNMLRMDLREYLGNIRDIERLSSRIAIGMANAREMVALSISINTLPLISNILEKYQSDISRLLKNIPKELIDLGKKISETLVDNPPQIITDGGLVRDGINKELDDLRALLYDDKSWLTELEQRERERTGIKNLKISFSKAFGYFIEITNSNKNLAPADYIRKQTLVNAERFITPELKERENAILTAEDKIKDLEYNIYCKLRDETSTFTELLQNIAYEIARLDVLSNLSEVSVKNKYIRPNLTDSNEIIVEEGRHPVIEQIIPAGQFVSNSVELNTSDSILMILTGPNMAGKSTYMRQLGLIIIMAQMGCFVPAKNAIISICDRIFTRVGAVDDLSTGQSTFMVEMNETANILNNATNKSFIILDEVGRGTSTYDGVSIAWAVSEYIAKEIGAKTIFATHYHELNKMEDKIKGVINYQVAVQETQDRVIFLHKVIQGYADRSYGIEVARLAGLPLDVINKAKDIMGDIEKRSKIQASLLKKGIDSGEVKTKEKSQLSLFEV
ncbi:MAG: DNA mismatch repair protein MutS [Candidatus Sericytochromatia bacterium]